MYTTNANLPNTENQANEPTSKLRDVVLIICLGIFVAMLMDGELGQWLSYLSENNFALNAGALTQDEATLLP